MPTTPAVTCVADAAAVLLAAGGAAKLRSPRSLARAAAGIGIPLPAAAVRAVAAAEVGVAGWAIAAGGPAAWAVVAASYLVFTGFVVLVRARGGVLASCGCFGGTDAPASMLHASVTAGYAVVAALAGGFGAGRVGAAGWGDAALALAAAVTVAFLSYAVLAVLPRTQAAARLAKG